MVLVVTLFELCRLLIRLLHLALQVQHVLQQHRKIRLRNVHISVAHRLLIHYEDLLLLLLA